MKFYIINTAFVILFHFALLYDEERNQQRLEYISLIFIVKNNKAQKEIRYSCKKECVLLAFV